MATTETELHAGLRAWADGDRTRVAAVELLIRNGRAIYLRAPWLTVHDGGNVSVDAAALRDGTGAYSSGELAVIDIAVSLLGGEPVDLSEALPRLEHAAAELVIATVSTAAGFDRPTTSVQMVDGGPRRVNLPVLATWPAEVAPA
ncbi:hypothetical protein [Leucobacter sp. cx-169]|uniref:hypothetical protein n=1 Tax=Leucobacter sp. cx-169 TaxID=2770549 RepID=UPI00165E5FE9|nr:hypothetical protein [Leucobacter sp. cx-169]MBC9927209.1 hypothetical protein [Leucobacter sp. cx-169]